MRWVWLFDQPAEKRLYLGSFMLKGDDRSRHQMFITGGFQLPLRPFLSSSQSIRFTAAAEYPVAEKSLLERLRTVGHKVCAT